MGRAAGAALKVAAPEATVAKKITPGMAPGDVNNELQRRRQVAAIRKRQRDRGLSEGQTTDEEPAAPKPAPAAPPPASLGGGPSLPAPAQTGSGFLLGVFAWALGLAYLQGGAPGVKKFMAAKFFNKV